MFESLETLPADAILKLIAEYRDDERPDKVDLGVGVYRTADGLTPVLEAVKEAERRLVDEQETKAYLGTAGSPLFNSTMQALTFGDAIDEGRAVTIQAPGGSGSLRVAADLLVRSRGPVNVWVGEPTWANHVPLLGGAGLELKPFPYYDTERHVIDADAMLESIAAIPSGDVILMHACCHNPSGLDPDEDLWRRIADLVADRELVPLVDMAYQGFAKDIDTDAFIIRELTGRVDEMIVTNSCSKNFGLYRDRVGSLTVMTRDAASRDVVASQLSNIVRTLYSMPPDHGAAIVAMILGDEELSASWRSELAQMRNRIIEMRERLHEALRDTAPDHDFSHLVRANGMFSFLGITEAQVDRLRHEHAIYMVGSSRINIAGVNAGNVEYLADSIAAVL